ncbi:MAG: GNAT family N-acetyltransferase [Acidobacteriota bacterium]
MTPVQVAVAPIVRVAVARDHGALVRLDRICFGPRAWPAGEWWEAISEPGWTTVVLECGGEVAGATVLILWPPVAGLASIAVHPSHRGRGWGGVLLRDAVRRACDAGARWLSLEVDADNRTAIELYRSEGFRMARRFVEDGRARLEMHRRVRRRAPRRPGRRSLGMMPIA